MTDTSRQNPTPADEQQNPSLKDLVRALARASARQFLSDLEPQSGQSAPRNSQSAKSEKQR